MNKVLISPWPKVFCGLLLSFLLVGCTHQIPRFGIGGRYQEGRDQFLRGKGGDMDKAIVALESVVKENPTYYDSLTLLGRAYYRKGRYEDAGQILRRALVVNKNDEIAWLVLGLAQLRLGEEGKGLETLKGAITLVSQVSTSGYRGFSDWDSKGLVRTSLRRAVFEVAKGLDEKQSVIQSVEALLARMDEEENFQRTIGPQQQRRAG